MPCNRGRFPCSARVDNPRAGGRFFPEYRSGGSSPGKSQYARHPVPFARSPRKTSGFLYFQRHAVLRIAADFAKRDLALPKEGKEAACWARTSTVYDNENVSEPYRRDVFSGSGRRFDAGGRKSSRSALLLSFLEKQ
jgi:hypothetical protein